MEAVDEKAVPHLTGWQLALLFFLTGGLTFTRFMLEGHTGINFSDEGYLWYGAQQINFGGVPLRDYISYDPGRYYWVAAIMKLVGNSGIITSRIAEAIFQEIGLFIGVILFARLSNRNKKLDLLLLVLWSLTLLLWMTPLYKSFDFTICILTIAVLTSLIESGSHQAWFWTGVSVSLIAFFGRNHGVYAVFGCLMVFIYLTIFIYPQSKMKTIACWVSGMIVGYLPMFIMILCIPGFSSSLIESIGVYFINGVTNISLPVPWPWHRTFYFSSVLYGDCFVALIVFAGISLCYVFYAANRKIQLNSLLVATSFMALPYAHYTFSRADIEHLSLGIFPLLLGISALFNERIAKTGIAISVLVLSLVVILPSHPGWEAYKDGFWEDVNITDNVMHINQNSAKDIKFFESLINKYASNREKFLVLPINLAMYPIFDRQAPVRDIYPLFKTREEFDQAEVDRIRKNKPAFIVIYNVPIGGHNEVRYCNLHPLIFQYILSNYIQVEKIDNYILVFAGDKKLHFTAR